MLTLHLDPQEAKNYDPVKWRCVSCQATWSMPPEGGVLPKCCDSPSVEAQMTRWVPPELFLEAHDAVIALTVAHPS